MKTTLWNKRLLSALLAVCLMTAVFVPTLHTAKAVDTMEAIPTTIGRISAKAGGARYLERIDKETPVYAIKQANGYYSNYMKLRDIAYYLDFDVVWSADEPNAMRLYTDRHYLDSWTAPGPATQTQAATNSTMDIYVDDMKIVADVHPVMIGYNNYFKVRDIATIMDFWCAFGSDGGQTYVTLDYNYHYVDEAALAAGATQSPQYAKTIQYQSPVWYDGNIGAVSDTPVTYALRDAWGNYDYTKLYLGYTHEGMNAVAQLMLDRNLINKDSSGVKQFDDGNKLNAYYRYPMIEFEPKNGSDGVLRYDDVFGDIQGGQMYNDSNFGVNLAIRSIGKISRNSKTEAGVLSVEYDAGNEFAKAREVTKKSAAKVFEVMDTLSCDAEKVQFLAACVGTKMQWGLETGGLDDIKDELVRYGHWREGTELALIYSFTDSTGHIKFEDIGKIWLDDKLYAGVCNDYSFVFENLCNAAGYYYVAVHMDGLEGRKGHIVDAVWLPDEGRWVVYDCQDALPRAMHKITDNRWNEGWNKGGWGFTGGGNVFDPWAENVTGIKEDVDSWNAEKKIAHYAKDAISPILDFFYMMEQIKPGGWLSSDVTQNP